MFGGLEDSFTELLRSLPIPCWLLGAIILLSAGLGPVPATAVHEFTAHRMQHFDMYGVRYGSRSALINMEAKGEAANMLSRRCVVVRWRDLTIEKFQNLIERGAGSILILLPPNNASGDNHEEWESWATLESELFKIEIPIPVYFVEENEELAALHDDLSSTAEREKRSSVASLLLAAMNDYGYQVVAGEAETKPIKALSITTIIGTLSGQRMGHSLPTLVILAHYDAMGLAPSLSYGVDSNASGAAALMEMSRLFSRLYTNSNLKPKYNLVFVLSGGGKFNYVGTKGLLEDLDSSEAASLLSSAEYTLCLDSLSMADSGNLYVHVSKPPKEGAKGHLLIQYLNQSAESLFPDFNLQLVHKKVRLSDDLLAWEHERFSLKRLPAATISSLQSHKDLRRSSMFVTNSQTNLTVLARNVRVLAEGIARFIYNVSELGVSLTKPILSGSGYDVSSGFLEMWVEFLTSHARSLQLLDSNHPVVVELEQAMKRYTDDVTVQLHTTQKSEQEFVVYDTANTKMTAYRVKPAVFDLFVAIAIALYSFIWYFTILFFGRIRSLFISPLPLPFSVRARPKTTKSE